METLNLFGALPGIVIGSILGLRVRPATFVVPALFIQLYLGTVMLNMAQESGEFWIAPLALMAVAAAVAGLLVLIGASLLNRAVPWAWLFWVFPLAALFNLAAGWPLCAMAAKWTNPRLALGLAFLPPLIMALLAWRMMGERGEDEEAEFLLEDIPDAGASARDFESPEESRREK